MELIIALLDFSGVGGCQIDLISATLLFIQNGKAIYVVALSIPRVVTYLLPTYWRIHTFKYSNFKLKL